MRSTTQKTFETPICDVTKIKKQLKMLHFLNIYPYFNSLYKQEMNDVRPPRKVLFRTALKSLHLSVFADESMHGRNNILKHMATVDSDRYFNVIYIGLFIFYLHRGGKTTRGGGISRRLSKNINSEKVCSSP